MGADFSKFTSVVSDAMKTAKAVLIFSPPNADRIEVEEISGGAGLGKEAPGGVADVLTNTERKLKEMEDKLHDLTKIAGPLQAAAAAGQEAAEDFRKVTFQFNPATLRISANGGGMAPIKSYGSKPGDEDEKVEENGFAQVDYGPIKENITVSFKVLFDAVRNTDAFLIDKINFSPTNLSRQGLDLIKGTKYTVRPVVEGFLASVRNSSSRRVIFRWGGMQYGGSLNKVQCRYTMFNIKGEPVRAEIDLSLLGTSHNDYDNLKEWGRRYDDFMNTVAGEKQNGNNFFKTGKILSGLVDKAYILFHKKFEEPAAVGGAGKELADYVPVKVQYNPSSVTLCSQGGEIFGRYNNTAGSPAAAEYQCGTIPMETVLSMDLIFDDTVNASAFMLDAGTGSPTGIIKAGRNLASRMAGREYSVAPISELFVAATASAYSRMVCVVWNQMTFWGELYEADVEYTMFHNRGNPIRSRVSIRVRQGGEADRYGVCEEAWQKAYKNLPAEAEKLVSDRRVTNSSGNFITSNLFRM